jgi:hypothetical protein
MSKNLRINSQSVGFEALLILKINNLYLKDIDLQMNKNQATDYINLKEILTTILKHIITVIIQLIIQP